MEWGGATGATHHVAQGHVEEEARGHREDPGLELLPRADRKGDVEAHEGSQGADEVEQQGQLDAQPGVEQSGEVSWGGGRQKGLVRKGAGGRAWPGLMAAPVPTGQP